MAISTKDFRNLPLEKWNGTTVRAYVSHLNEEKFGIPCISKSVQMENSAIKRLKDEFGIEVVKEFVEACVSYYKPTPAYPTVNFAFMYSYMKEYELPKVLKKRQEKSKLEMIKEQQQKKMDSVADYF